MSKHLVQIIWCRTSLRQAHTPTSIAPAMTAAASVIVTTPSGRKASTGIPVPLCSRSGGLLQVPRVFGNRDHLLLRPSTMSFLQSSLGSRQC